MSGRVPPSSRSKVKRRARTPTQKAALLYERFSGHEANDAVRVKVPSAPKVAVCIGDLDGVLYTTVRDGRVEKYIHKFAKKDRPLLCVTPDGSQLLLVGGHYTFTERGIVDKSDKTG